VLEQLFYEAARDAAERETRVSREELEGLVSTLERPKDVYRVLSRANRIKLIAEIKRASPSKGFMAEIPDPAALGLGYEKAGADAISVLTERTGFRGSLEDLRAVAASVSIPVLRKDFISTEYQILEARANGASFALLILAHLSVDDALKLMNFAQALGMGVLVETHTVSEIDIANDIGARLVGINTRNLKTFETDLGLYEKLAGRLPSESIKVAESSVKQIEDVVTYRNAGADVVLVGEALVTGDWNSLIPQIVSVS
jgi:indole-3-glycerol phosphate synthase